MNEEQENNSFTIGDFKNQVSEMVKAISYFSSNERNEAFGYLQSCLKNLHCHKDFEDQDQLTTKNNEDCNNVEESLTPSDGAAGYDSDLTCKQDSDSTNNLDESNKCCSCDLVFDDLKELYLHGLKDHPGHLISCKICQKNFSNCQFYQLHINLPDCCLSSNGQSEVHKCTYCDKEYHNFQHYSLHIEGHKRNKCEDCGIHFNSRKNLAQHCISEHNKELDKELFNCKFCDRKYSQKRSLLKHYKLLHSNDNIICLTCGDNFETIEGLKDHEKTHSGNKPTFLCYACGEKFTRHQQFTIHIKTHDKYQCVTCNFSCTNKVKLEKHEHAGHVIKGLPTDHQCSDCDSAFHFQSSLFFHKKIHSVSNDCDYGCDLCKRLFKSYYTYKDHLTTEQHLLLANPGGYSDALLCKYCNKLFPNKRRLLKHINHNHKTKQLYHCEICDFKSFAETNLNKHIKLHTQKKEFICDKCGDSFYTKNALLDHCNYVHNDERNFSCEKCGQTFKSASVLNRHMLSHSKEPKFKCHCGQAYKFSGNLNRHQLLVHGQSSKSKRVKRLVNDEVAKLTSKISKNKKQDLKDKHLNNATAIYTLIDSQTTVSLPLEQIISQGNLLTSGNHSDSQMIQVSYHNLNFSPDNRTPLILSQNLDVATLQEVGSILQSEDSLKTSDRNAAVDSSSPSIFGQNLSDPDGSTFLDSDSLIHPPIEPSLVTSLEDSSLNSVDHHLDGHPVHSHQQPHLPSVGESYYGIQFLGI